MTAPWQARTTECPRRNRDFWPSPSYGSDSTAQHVRDPRTADLAGCDGRFGGVLEKEGLPFDIVEQVDV
jgi:hypothetical protein